MGLINKGFNESNENLLTTEIKEHPYMNERKLRNCKENGF